MKSIPVLKKTRSRFFSGVLVLVPLAITVIVFRFVVRTLAGFGRPLLMLWMDQVPQFAVDLLGFGMALALIYLAGLFVTHIAGRRLVRMGESLLLKLPLVNSVYGASKHVIEAFASETANPYRAVAFVEFPRQGCQAIAFVTGTMRDKDDRLKIRVFVPTAPNPTSGFLLILPESDVIFTDISVEAALKTVLSGGALGPERYHEIKPPDIQTAPLGSTLDT